MGIERWPLCDSVFPVTPKRSSDLAPLSIPPDDFVPWMLTEPVLPPCPLEDTDPRGETSPVFIEDAVCGLNESMLVKLLLRPCKSR